MLLQQQSSLAKYLFQCRLVRNLIGESTELARLINASVNGLRLKSRSPEHDWKVLRALPRQDLSPGVVNRYIPGNPKGEVVKCTRIGPGGVEFDHLVQGMFLCFNFPLRPIGASSLSGCDAFPSCEAAIFQLSLQPQTNPKYQYPTRLFNDLALFEMPNRAL
jgi:hypothetical protein